MNKLMARIVAVVLAVMMLGTVSFAAPELEPELNQAKDTITTNATAYKTIKALAGETIIALYQGETLPETIKIDPAKIGTNKTITVMYGGGTEGLVTQTVDVPAEPDTAVEVDVKTTYETKDGVTYKDVANVSKEFTVEAGKVATEVGYVLTVVGGDADGNSKTFSKQVNLSGSGTFKYDIVFLGVPAGVTIKADGFIKY